jgi:hypothetical protein
MVARQTVTPSVVDEVLGDPQPAVALDVGLEVLAVVAAIEDLQRQIEALGLCADHPAIALVRLHVQHGDQIGRKHALRRVIDGQVRREIHLALHAPKERLEGAERPVLGQAMPVAFRRERRLDLGWQRVDDARALVVAQRRPHLFRRRARIGGIDLHRRTRAHAPILAG